MKNNDELSKKFEDIRKILDIRNLNEYQNKCIENSVGTEKQIEVKRKKINKKSLKKIKLSDFICCSILALSLVSGTILLVKTGSDIKKDYEIDLDDEFIKELDIKDEKDVLVICLITLGKSLKDSTANLKAPIIINIKNN